MRTWISSLKCVTHRRKHWSTTTAEDALALIDKLDPNREPGRLTFITRMGAKNIREKLPTIVAGVQAAGAQVIWVTDPMHG